MYTAKRFWVAWTVIVLFVLVIFGSSSAQSYKSNISMEFVPFEAFLENVFTAQLSMYQSKGTSRVESPVAFDDMKAHIMSMYLDTDVLHSFVGLDSHFYDCIPINQQPGLRRPGMEHHNVQLTPPTPPIALLSKSATTLPKSSATTMQFAQSQTDQFGNVLGCQENSIPMRRLTLDDMTRFKTLQAFFMAGVHDEAPTDDAHTIQQVNSITRRYAHAYQIVDNYGGSHWLNIWNPTPTPNNNNSISQHWYIGGTDSSTQTVEGGWIKNPDAFQSDFSVLFIFATPDNYTSGCYNLLCAAFIQIDNTWILGGPWQPGDYSVRGGGQWDYRMAWYRDPATGHWWLFMQSDGDSTAVGYYPQSFFGSGQLSKYATSIDYGGEVTGDPSGEMGSGAFASEGFQFAAYQRQIYYHSISGELQWATLTPSQDTPTCYTIDLLTNTTDANWGTYFFFGGPRCPN